MPGVGDVFVRFLGDTSALFDSFDQVDARQQKTAATAAASTVELKQAQAELRAALAATSTEAGMTADNMATLQAAEERVAVASFACKEAHLALREELGIASATTGYFSTAAEELTSKLAGMLGLLALLESVKGFTENVIESQLALQNLSERSGISITKLAGLEEMAKANGVNFDQMSKAVTRLEVAQVTAIQTAGKQRDAFAALGISVDQLRQMSPEQLFFKVAEALTAANPPQIQLAAGAALFSARLAGSFANLKQYHGHIEEIATEMGIATGTTDASGRAAREYQRVMTEVESTVRSVAIVALPTLVSVLKNVVTFGSAVSLGFKDMGATIDAMIASSMLTVSRFAKTAGDLIHGDFQKAWNDGKNYVSDFGKNLNKLDEIYKTNAETFQKSYVELWADRAPAATDKASKSLEDLAQKNKHATQDAAAEAKARLDADMAAIAQDKAALKLALAEKTIDIKTFVDKEAELIQTEKATQTAYYNDLIALYKKAGDAAKVKEAVDKQAAEASKQRTTDLEKQAATISDLEKETRKYAATAASVIPKAKEVLDANDKSVQALDQNWKKFVPAWAEQAKKLNEALKLVKVEGMVPLEQKMLSAASAEKVLEAQHMKGSKLWLEIEKQKLTAAIALAQMEGREATKEIKALKDVEVELRKFDKVQQQVGQTAKETWEKNQNAIETFKSAALDAFQALAQGGQSFVQAMEKATGQLISTMAQNWAKYFFGMALADAVTPGKQAQAAGEFAAAAALEVLAGVAGSLGSSSGSSGHSGSSSAKSGPPTGPNPVSAPTGAPSSLNAPHMAGGGLVTGPTMIMAGDAMSAGAASNSEAILPLHNRRAMDMIADALASRMRDHGGYGGVTINVGGMISPQTLNRTMKQVTAGVKAGSVRLTSGVSLRNTRRG